MNAIKWLCLAIISIAVIGQYGAARQENRSAQFEYVYNVCNHARTELDGESRAQCGEAQDSTHSEFMCDRDDMLPSTHCWVEGR